MAYVASLRFAPASTARSASCRQLREKPRLLQLAVSGSSWPHWLVVFNLAPAIDYLNFSKTLNKTKNFIHQRLNHPVVIADQRKTQLSALPNVLFRNLRDLDTQLGKSAILYLAEHPPLLFQRVATRKIEFDLCDAYNHKKALSTQLSAVSQKNVLLNAES
jgi:hypothetical protein